jgi:hypothetical protein
VETAGEALYARDGEDVPFCGVRLASGCARTFFAFVAGDCDWELVERAKWFDDVDWASEVDDMLYDDRWYVLGILVVVYDI